MKTKLIIRIIFLLLLSSCNSSSGGSYIECGGPRQFVCPNSMFCNLAKECGGLDASGVCRPIPTDCPNVDQPICACNGKTYANECYAMASLQSIAYQGPCIKK